jgi:DNA-binding SARP family transcriptional activator
MSSKVTYRQQFTRCGKQRCHKCREGAGHGPYWYAYWSENGRTMSKYIGTRLPPEIQRAKQATNGESTNLAHDTPPGRSHTSNSTLFDPPLTDARLVLRVYLLGQFRVEQRTGNGWQAVANRTWHRRRARALLGCLLSSPGRMLGREQAMEALWPDLDIDTAANRLNGAVHELRQILEPEIARPAASRMLRLERDVLKLADASHIWVDAEAFESLLNKANTAANAEQAEQILEEAAALYGGDYLLEELYSEWAAPRRQALRRGWMGLLLNLAELRAARGALTSAIEPLDRLLTTDPIHETAVRRLMTLLTQLDRRGEAFRVYQQLVTVLERDYTTDPLPETRELYEALRQGQIQALRPTTTAFLGPQQHYDKSSTPITATQLSQPLAPGSQKQAEPRIVAPIGSTRQFGRHNQSPLIGRDHELAMMREFMSAVEYTPIEVQEARNTIVHSPAHFLLLIGESGIGKTRLAEEVSQEAGTHGWSVVWSRAYEQEGTIPYRPWIDVLRTLLQDVPTEFLLSSVGSAQPAGPAVASSGTTHYALTAHAKLERLSVLLPELVARDTFNGGQHSSSAPMPPEQERLHLWETTLALLSALSKINPLLLVLDDLHWADESSLELLAYLVRHLQDEHILFVGTCRGMELTPTSSLRMLINDLRREQAIVTLPVQPLTNYEIRSLVAHLPENIVQSIETQAGGNPFFAEELARVSEASIHLQLDAESRVPVTLTHEDSPATSNRTSMPETIAAVLDRRLSRLSNDCQTLLGKAAVLGGSFELNQLLSMASDQSHNNEDVILDLLEEALRAGLLVEEEAGTRITYHFWHPLIVNHLYERLSAARRAQLHRRAANALLHIHKGHDGLSEAQLQQSVAADITYHLSKGGGDPKLIAHYAEIAGNQAYTLSAYSQAQRYYRQAIEALTAADNAGMKEPGKSQDLLHLAHLLELVAECNAIEGNYEEVKQFYMQALELRNQQWAYVVKDKNAEELHTWWQQEAQIQALIWREIGRAWHATGEYARAHECYTRGKQVMYEAGVTSGTAWACLHLQMGTTCWIEGNYDEARRYAQEALEVLEQAMQDQLERDAKTSSANATNAVTAIPQLQTLTVRAIIGDPFQAGRAYELLGVIAFSLGQFTEALKHLHTALAIFERHNIVMAIAQVCGNIGAAHTMRAENTVARTYFRRCLELAERMGDLPNMAFVTGNLGDVALRCGDLIEAEEWLRRSLALAERINDREHQTWCHITLAIILQDQGNLSGALQNIRRGLSLCRAMKGNRWIGFALVTLGDWRVTQAINIHTLQTSATEEDTGLTAVYNRLLIRAKAALQRALTLEGLEAEVTTAGQLVLASVYFLLGDLETAQQKATQALEEARLHEFTRMFARSQRLLGRILAAQGQREQADHYFEEAISTFLKHEMRLDYARTLHGYGHTLMQHSSLGEPKYERGRSFLREAQDIFAGCKAAIDLEWVENVLKACEQPMPTPQSI